MAASGQPQLRGTLISHMKSCAESPALLEAMNKMLIGEMEHARGRISQLKGGGVPVGESDEEMARRMQLEMQKEEEEQRSKEAAENEMMLHQLLNTCEMCGTRVSGGEQGEGKLHLLSCDHRLCVGCAAEHIVGRMKPQKQSDYVCPKQGCGKQLQQADAKALLSEQEFDTYLDSALTELDSANANFRRCPTGCGWGMLLEDASTSAKKPARAGELGLDKKPLTLEAIRHRDQFRFRCRLCHDTEFCAMCNASPYHLGLTCDGYRAFMAKRKCRFCGGEVVGESALILKDENRGNKKALHKVLHARSVDSIPKGASQEALLELIQKTDQLANVCKLEECITYAQEACTRVMDCGHLCLGTRGESTCLGCLDCNSCDGQSATDYCNICWVSDLTAAPCVRLKCGHIFHMHCIVEKITAKWAGARISFGFLGCPLCKEHMQAEQIEKVTEEGFALYKAVRIKAEQRLALEGGHGDAEELKEGGRYHGQPVNYAMHKFAYYVCFKCKSPYFGGYRSCDEEAGEEERKFDASELVCGGCSAAGSTTCSKHGSEAIEHKCKFCCSVASWYCWGTTHFCDSCHRKQGTPESMSRKPRNQLPVCTPETCPLKIPHPPNGEEFVLGCQICRSASFC